MFTVKNRNHVKVTSFALTLGTQYHSHQRDNKVIKPAQELNKQAIQIRISEKRI